MDKSIMCSKTKHFSMHVYQLLEHIQAIGEIMILLFSCSNICAVIYQKNQTSLLKQREGNSSKDKNDSECWYDQRDIDDEEFPLTFSDKVSIKDLSRKAKKVMKW